LLLSLIDRPVLALFGLRRPLGIRSFWFELLAFADLLLLDFLAFLVLFQAQILELLLLLLFQLRIRIAVIVRARRSRTIAVLLGIALIRATLIRVALIRGTIARAVRIHLLIRIGRLVRIARIRICRAIGIARIRVGRRIVSRRIRRASISLRVSLRRPIR